MWRTIAALTLGTALLAESASADAQTRTVERNPIFKDRPAASPFPKPPCECRLRNGTRVPLGTTTCLKVGGREFTAECRMASNVTMWREVSKGCPTS